MPITYYRDNTGSGSPTYTTTYTTVTKQISLLEAFRKVVSGDMTPIEVYVQLQGPVKEVVDRAVSEGFGKGFHALDLSDQKEVFSMLLIALEHVNDSSK